MKSVLIIVLSNYFGLIAYSQMDKGVEFIKNEGQWNNLIQYRAPLSGGDLWVEENTLTFNYYSEEDFETYHEVHHNEIEYDSTIHSIRMNSFEMQFLNSSSSILTESYEENSNYYNYFIGNDTTKWATNVSSYQKIELKNVYTGIDVSLYTENSNLKYDITLDPGADPSLIQIQFDGVNPTILNNKLYLKLSVGDVFHTAPIAYQIINNKKKQVQCNYLLKEGVLSFEFPDDYDKDNILIIDPELIFSTYTGSTADNFGFTATFDSNGNLYAGGIAYDIGYPTTIGAYQSSFEGEVDMSITKFNEDGSDLIYSTYVGGDYNDYPQSMIEDNNGNLCIFGSSSSSNFPVTQNAYQTEINDYSDIVVVKLSPEGDDLIASTYFGGNSVDGGMMSLMHNHDLSINYADEFRGEVIVDNDNSVYFASFTKSSDFPTSENAEKDTLSGQMDGVIVHLSENLDELLFSTYIGGSESDILNSIKKKDDLIIVGGGTRSLDFEASNDALFNGSTGSYSSGIILTVNENGTVNSSSYIGDGDTSMVYFVDIGPEENVYVHGICSGNYPVSENVYSNPYSQQFIQEIDQNLTTSIQSTTFGSSDTTYNSFSSTAFMVDDCGLIYVSGHIAFRSNIPPDPNFPVTSNAFQDSTDGRDFYIIVFNKDFQSLLVASYFGEYGNEEHVDGGTSRFKKDGTIFHAVCAGCGGTSGFPVTPGVWSETNNSTNCNLAAFKINMEAQDVDANVFTEDTLVCGGNPPFEMQFEHEGRAAPYYFWDFGDGYTSNLQDPIHFYEEAGVYTIQHIVIDSTICVSSDTAYSSFEISFVEDFIMDWNVAPPLNCKDTLYVALEFSGQSADSLVWDMGDGTIYYHNPVFYQYDVPGSYEVILEAYDLDCDNEGIFNTDFYLEEGLTSSKVGVPNIISPNGDGINDYFQLYYLSIPQDDPLNYIEDLSMKIYNRWGRLIYESSSDPDSWRWNGETKDKVVSEGVYFYIIEYKSLCEGGGIDKFAGSVTVVRE